MQKNDIDKLITEALAIEAEDAKETGALGYMSRSLVQATMPHRSTKGNEFTRKNGTFTLSMLAPSDVGLPFGSMPRLLISWITTEAVLKRDREIIFGNTLSGFMHQLGYDCTGGRWGSIARLRQQMRRLFSSAIMCSYTADNQDSILNFVVADEAKLWWDPKKPDQADIWKSSVLPWPLIFIAGSLTACFISNGPPTSRGSYYKCSSAPTILEHEISNLPF